MSGKLSVTMLNILTSLYANNVYISPWLNNVKCILDECGMSDVFYHPHMYEYHWLVSTVFQRLSDQFIQKWQADQTASHKGTFYLTLKPLFGPETYIYLPEKLSIPLIKFRTSNHFLPVETGRWSNISYDNRKCTLCNFQCIGNEYHYLLVCPYFEKEREMYLHPFYYVNPNDSKFYLLLGKISNTPMSILRKLSIFINCILKAFVN